MISQATYQAAHAVASTVENHFAQKIEAAQQRGEQDLATAPPARVIEAMIDVAFWASLRREEGRPPKISLAFLPPGQAAQSFLLEHRLALTASTLTKLAPGVERAGIHLGVWYEEDELYVWGTTLTVPNYCFVLDVSEPGLLVIKYRRRHGFGKFVNVAVLIGDQIKIVDEQRANFPERPSLLTSLLSFNGTTSGQEQSLSDEVNVLIQLAVSMRSHQHGGTLLIVPAESQTWPESILRPMKYAIKPAFAGLAELMRQQQEERSQSEWQSALRNKVESMAGLTAIDGATVINDQYELLAFGAKIRSRQGRTPIERILMTEPITNSQGIVANPSQIGGTRHLSAAQFTFDQPESLALVASQDGRFTVFSWSVRHEMVQAHRIDSLLL